MSRSQRAFSGGALLFVQVVLRLATPVIVSPILVRISGDDVLGAYAIILELIGYVMLLDFGIGTAIAREMSRYTDRDETETRDAIAASAVRFLAIVGAVAAAVTGLVAVTLDRWLAAPAATLADARSALLLLGVWMALRFPLSFFQLFLYARQDISRFAISEVWGELVRASSSVAFVMAGGGIIGLALATILGQVVALGLCAVWSASSVRSMNWKRPARGAIGRLLRVSYPLGVMSLADRMTLFTQNTLVGWLFDARIAAAFYVTRTPGFYAGSIIWRLADATFPAMSEMYGAGLHDALRRAYVRTVGYALGAGVWLAAGIVVFSGDLVTIWVGHQFYLGLTTVVAIAVLVLVATFRNMSAKFVVAEGQIRPLMWLVVAEAILALGLSVVFARFWGPAGIVWAAAATSVVSGSYLLLRPAATFGGGTRALIAAVAETASRCCALPVLMLLLFTLVRFALPPGSWIGALIVNVVVGGGAFVLIGLEPADRHAVIRLVRKPGRPH